MIEQLIKDRGPGGLVRTLDAPNHTHIGVTPFILNAHVKEAAVIRDTAKPFDVKIDRIQRVITIQGIRYTFDLFDQLGFADTGSCFEIGKRHNGAVELIRLSRPVDTVHNPPLPGDT